MSYPTVEYPTILEGKIWGDSLRLESLDGSQKYFGQSSWSGPWPDGIFWDGDGFRLVNAKPWQSDGKIWGVPHLQKQSGRGWMKVSPDCFHWWCFWKPQQKDAAGNWLPGTERGIYFRKSAENVFGRACWRWDIPGTIEDGVLHHWIRSGGYFGGHWD